MTEDCASESSGELRHVAAGNVDLHLEVLGDGLGYATPAEDSADEGKFFLDLDALEELDGSTGERHSGTEHDVLWRHAIAEVIDDLGFSEHRAYAGDGSRLSSVLQETVD